MATEHFLVEKPSPGSDACILIGRMPEGMKGPGEPWRRVLWIVDAAGAAGGLAALAGAAVSVLPVEECTAAQLEAAVDDFLAKTPKHLPALYATRGMPPEYAGRFATAIGTVGACLEAHHRARVTRQKDAFAWQSNLFENASGYVARRLPDQWEGALAGLPAMVCGAGPSLGVSVEALARMAGKGVVLAADSSLKALARVGVEADFAVSVDVAKTPVKCLPEGLGPGRVVLSVNSPPEWTEAMPGDRRYYVSSNQLTLDWMASLGVARTKVAVCENCGSTAIELARFLGCAPICVFGMDLALNADGPVQRHHEGVERSLYANSGFNPEQEFPRVPGNFSTEVPTHVIGDWRALDRRLAGWPAGLVWVVTDCGARLSNTRVLRPEEFALPGAGGQKESRLEGLARPAAATAGQMRMVSEKLGRFGQGLVEWAPALRKALETGGGNAVAGNLRSLFAVPEHGQMLGAYSLKLMPHLLPPVEEEGTDWRGMIDELESLGREAGRAAKALGR
jgi:hypothetical protein